MLNFQGTVYIKNGFCLKITIRGGSILSVNPGSVLIINQQLCLLVIIGTVSVEASNYTTFVFNKKYVDSNTYTDIMSTTKLYDSNISTIKITNIYKANGDLSTYKYVWVKVRGGTATKIQKGSWYDLPVYGEYAKKWRIVTLSAKGNDPTLDCQISGNWIAY